MGGPQRRARWAAGVDRLAMLHGYDPGYCGHCYHAF